MNTPRPFDPSTDLALGVVVRRYDALSPFSDCILLGWYWQAGNDDEQQVRLARPYGYAGPENLTEPILSAEVFEVPVSSLVKFYTIVGKACTSDEQQADHS